MAAVDRLSLLSRVILSVTDSLCTTPRKGKDRAPTRLAAAAAAATRWAELLPPGTHMTKLASTASATWVLH